MHIIKKFLGVISPEIHGRRDQTFKANASKRVISPKIAWRRDQKFEANALKGMISPESS